MIEDIYDVGRVVQPMHSDAFPWGVIYNAAVVEATRPDSTVDSVIHEALKYASPERTEGMSHSPRDRIEEAIVLEKRAATIRAMER